MKLRVTLGVTALIFVSSAHATPFTEVDITSQTNANIQTYTAGGNYPLGGSTLTVGGVPFLFAGSGATNVVQSSGAETFNFTVPSGTQATALYTLMNTSWGVNGAFQGSITVTGSLSETATLNLTEGVNIRDHYNGGFVNTLSDATVIPTDFVAGLPNPLGQVRLDRQELLLPNSFAGDTIASITFSTPNAGYPQGAPFLAAMTLKNQVATAPDGGSLAGLLAIGMVALTAVRRRSRLMNISGSNLLKSGAEKEGT